MAEEYVSLTDDMKAIPNLEGYFAKRDGTVWSGWRTGMGMGLPLPVKSVRRLRGRPNVRSGHIEVKHKKKLVKLHHMILWAFVGDCPPGMECRHLDGNPANNRLDNLRWGTRKENVADSMRHGTFAGFMKKEDFKQRRAS